MSIKKIDATIMKLTVEDLRKKYVIAPTLSKTIGYFIFKKVSVAIKYLRNE